MFTHKIINGPDHLTGQQEGHPRAQTIEHLGDGGGGDPLPRAEPGAGESQGGAPHHDVGHPVEDGAEVAAGREQAVVRVRHIQRDAPEHSHHGLTVTILIYLRTVPRAMKPLVTTMASLREWPSSQTMGMKATM